MHASLFSELTNVEFAFGLAMFLLLVLSAICDFVCQEVPDSLTVSYVILSCVVAAERGELWLAIVLMLAEVYVQTPWRPKWHKRFNEWMVHRAYKGDMDAVRDTQMASEEHASALFSGYGRWFHIAGLDIAFCSILLVIISGWSKGGPSVLVVMIAGMVYIVLSEAVISKLIVSGVVKEHEDISAMGGADVLVLLGILGYYGLFGGCCAIVVSLFISLLWYMVKRLITKSKEPAFALLPSLCISAPVRLFVVVSFATPLRNLLESVNF